MTKFLNFGKSLWQDEEGATAIEYGLLAALISVAIIVTVTSLGGDPNGRVRATSTPSSHRRRRRAAAVSLSWTGDLLRSGARSSMRIFLVILAALIVAGGTGFYVLQGLRPAAPRWRRLRLRS